MDSNKTFSFDEDNYNKLPIATAKDFPDPKTKKASYNDEGQHIYKLSSIPVAPGVDGNISFDDISSIRHLVDGSNSCIFKAILKGNEKVILKLMKDTLTTDAIVIREFEAEKDVLSKLRYSYEIHHTILQS